MTLLIDGVAHGAEDDAAETWCGIPISSTAREWLVTDEGSPVCPTCKRVGVEGARSQAQEWIDGDLQLVGLVGPCGQHLLSLGHREDAALQHAMALAPRGSKFARPTAEQLVGLMNNERCDRCIVSRF
ncbi:hypothetical protein IF188_09660 [Microbacterium sp. NEAU-LLC]|uniref:Uncharacterized protein n=1 Tax=Microbacterium helvum TaxID=2773713 RepID=A0ABR8NMS8_9MICO|nr:hypothetical protein [Microbacterium helvum]MBD3941960.1 hypothetical protein [Microbacterium helvum]